MISFTSTRSLRFSFLVFLISQQILSGLANNQSGAQNENKDESHGASRSNMRSKILLICLGLVALITFGVVLFKLWQKKKREEQHARLLKLFEDDDELEVELGMRD
ncbi:hypothetical protein L6164_023757 [Bauhinia variegata]|uniref:Uncharacterized protein n=1 Tax=Bauhinia variegata TaxID=167791 RepID=A0ACB9MJI1_BAUVA|nr:hypothetical protein L6164_023757 [Bauhinia variegata]